MKLRVTHWEQLLAYIRKAEEGEWYYGNREQFKKRHVELLKWATAQTEIASKK